ncbi:protein VAC14 homolog [Parasteatoda tepidariorum]|uniref:Protein VAC14 homolog n=1 Tax=Parasteatoda tepidariorum TaxID=114398 RepID=A0A2L2YQZ5_PARTP|nr:protein VAC14 homolog [Parasteatoda tepidariorum]
MSEKDYAPLSTYCVRALNDKLYEKRKTAALEIEKMVRDFLRVGEIGEIRKLLRVLGQDFTRSQNINSRKGGLIGLAATAIALGKDTSMYVDELVQPSLSCFNDQDSRVRYYACETLYNIVKVARGSVLPYFPDIFDALSRLSADPDQNVKNGSELVDRLMKDIVTESSSFDLVAFMPLLRERICCKNPFTRQFIISWVSTLDSVPDINMLVFLPEILDGLFVILGDPLAEIRKMCESVLGEFLKSIIENPRRVNFNDMVNILTIHANSTEELVQFTALTWLKEFVRLAGCTLLPYSSGILTAVLPNLAQDTESRRNIIETAKTVNSDLMKLVVQQKQQLTCESADDAALADKIEAPLMDQLDNQLDLKSLVIVLTKQIKYDSIQTRIAVLRWIHHLLIQIPDKLFMYVEDIFPVLLQTLSDPSDEVVLLDLEVLAEISKSSAGMKYHCGLENVASSYLMKELKLKAPANLNSYFTSFMMSLLHLFNTNNQLFETKCPFIIRQLCILLNAEEIYLTLSEILVIYNDSRFSCHMVHTLNNILLTSTELFELRNQLKELKTESSWSLFKCLYLSWCHSPVATVSLCLLAQTYKHACDLLQLFGDIEVTVDFLTEIDKLVQLIESPIFTFMRLQLLDAQQNPYLVKSLYGLLMLLPQSDAFHTLKNRLACVPNVQLMPPLKSKSKEDRKPPSFINFDELISHFKELQDRRLKEKKAIVWK